MVKRILISLLFFLIAQIALFCLVSYTYPVNMERYYYNLTRKVTKDIYKLLNKKRVIFNPEIKLVQGFNQKRISDSISETIDSLSANTDYAYLSYTKEVKEIAEKNRDLKIIGKNVFALNTAFLVAKDSNLELKNRSGSILNRYLVWLREIFRGNFGYTYDETDEISDVIGEKLPKTLFLVIYSILINLIISIGMAYLVVIFMNKRSAIIENVMEMLSVIPDFLIALFMIFIFKYKFKVFNDYDDVYRDFNFSYLIKNFSASLYYFLYPAVTIAFSNGNISFLFKNLLQKMQTIRSGVFFTTSKANGMRKRYLYFVFIFKEILPMTFRYISQRVPLIIGASIIVDWVFDINGIGCLMVRNFKEIDIGCILIIFSFLYLFSIILDILSDYLAKILKPRESKRNVE